MEHSRKPSVRVTRGDRGFDALNWNLCSDVGTTNRAAGGGSSRPSSGTFDQSAFKLSHKLQNSGHSPTFWS